MNVWQVLGSSYTPLLLSTLSPSSWLLDTILVSKKSGLLEKCLFTYFECNLPTKYLSLEREVTAVEKFDMPSYLDVLSAGTSRNHKHNVVSAMCLPKAPGLALTLRKPQPKGRNIYKGAGLMFSKVPRPSKSAKDSYLGPPPVPWGCWHTVACPSFSMACTEPTTVVLFMSSPPPRSHWHTEFNITVSHLVSPDTRLPGEQEKLKRPARNRITGLKDLIIAKWWKFVDSWNYGDWLIDLDEG